MDLQAKLDKENSKYNKFNRLKKTGIILLIVGICATFISSIIGYSAVSNGSSYLFILSNFPLILGIITRDFGLTVTIVFSIFTKVSLNKIKTLQKLIIEEFNIDLQQKINAETHRLKKFNRLKKTGILLLALGGIFGLSSILIVPLLIESEIGYLFSYSLIFISTLAMEVGLVLTIMFSIFSKKKSRNIVELKKQLQEQEAINVVE